MPPHNNINSTSTSRRPTPSPRPAPVWVLPIVECRPRQNQDRRIDQERKQQRQTAIQRPILDRALAALGAAGPGAGLYDGGVEVQVVRHHRCAQDANGDVQHVWAGEELAGGDKALANVEPVGLSDRHLVHKAAGKVQQQQQNKFTV